MHLSREKMNVILMYDSGESKRFRVRRSRYRLLISFCILSPCIAAMALAGCYFLWQEYVQLGQQYAVLEKQSKEDTLLLTRLQNVQALLERRKKVENVIAAHVMAEKNTELTVDLSAPEVQNDLQQEGPGHALFPELNTGVLMMENVSASLLDSNRLRVAFNLRNSGTEPISGEVFCILSLADGNTVTLQATPPDAATYKVSNFKSAVLFIPLVQEYDLTNAQVILEVKNHKNEPVYRNLYPLTQ